MSKEWIVTNKQELDKAFQEIFQVLKKTNKVKIQAASTKSKSKQQLAFYWGVIIPLLTEFYNETGLCSMTITKSDTNDILNKKFFYEEIKVGNEVERVTKSKSNATMEEMRIFIDNVIDYCTNLGVYIPPPENGSIYD